MRAPPARGGSVRLASCHAALLAVHAESGPGPAPPRPSLLPMLCSQRQAAETPLSSTTLRVVEQLCGLHGEVFGLPDANAGRAALGLAPQVGVTP